MAELEPPPGLAEAIAGRYRIERPLGQGGMATVWLARDLRHQREVALKVMRPGLAESLGADRFLREIRIVAGLNHPHILPLLDSGAAAGFLYYVMPHVRGESLRVRIRRQRQLALDEALDIAARIGEALTHAHAQGVIHRDIKPENILFEGNHPIVVDFGIARAVSLAGGDSLTASGVAVGTPAYMSPEQGGGETEVDGRTDVYSLACVVYEMLAGTPPFAGATVQSLLARHRTDPVPPLRTVRPAIPEPAESAILRALSKVPADRFATPAEFVAALSRPAPPGPRRARRLGLGVLAVLFLGAIGLIGRMLLPPRPIRIAVLAYQNLGPAEEDYFAEGIAEEIRNRLGGLPGVTVIGRQSILAYKNSRKTAREIGADLHVEYLLGGTVQLDHSGGPAPRWKITSELQRASSNETIWSGREEGEYAGIFAMEAGVARGVVGALDVRLLASARPSHPTMPTEKPEAYQEYLVGRSLWQLRTPEGIEGAIRHYERAAALDSNFAAAQVALADAWRSYPNFWSRVDSTRNLVPTAAEAYGYSARASRRALALDSTLVEPRALLSVLNFRLSRDVPRAESELRPIIPLAPDLPQVRNALRGVYSAAGRAAEALEQSRKAVELDPLEPIGNTFYAVDLAATGRAEDAMQALRRAVEVSPRFAPAYMVLGTLLWQSGRKVAGADSLRTFLSLRGYPAAGDSIVAAALAGRASAAAAIAVLDEFTKLEWEPEVRLAGLYALLGAREKALAVMEAANARREDEFKYQRYQPFLAPLFGEPRFKALWAEYDRR